MIGDIIRVFNRAPWPITITKDGRQYVLPPGYGHLRSDLVPLGKDQNPIMGTENPNNGLTQSYLSVVSDDPTNPKVQRDPLDAIPEEVAKAFPKERLDRNLLPPDRQAGAAEWDQPGFPRGRLGVEAPSTGMIDMAHERGN